MRRFLLFVVLSFVFAVAHGEEEAASPPTYLPIDPFPLALYVFALVLFVVAASLLFPSLLTPSRKKMAFLAIAVPVGAVTLYLAASTVYLNLTSESGGPVHWHADFEIWLCGEKAQLPHADLPANYVGTPVLHYHDDNRIHVEGVVVKKEDIALHRFFEAIGGELSGTSITVPLEGDRQVAYSNGNVCPNGRPGRLKLFVKNHETGTFYEEPALEDYVIKPHFEVPPGDYLKIVFE